MLQALEIHGEVSGSFFTLEDAHYLNRITEIADAVVICRSRYSAVVEQFINQARRKNLPVLFDIDDFVFDSSKVSLIVDTLSQDNSDSAVWDYWFAYTSRLRATLDMCDKVITTNDYLADKITQYTGKLAGVVPNFLNAEQLSYSDRITNEKLSLDCKRDDNFTLGYFSGSPSHDKDFQVLEDSLIEILCKFPSVSLLVVGFLNLNSRLRSFGNQVTTIPLQDYINLQKRIAEVDLNVVPLQINEFTNCKSELKFFEASIVSTPTIASKTHTFEAAIQDQENGFLVKSYDWFDTLEAIIQGNFDLRDIARNANDDCKTRYHYKNFGQDIKSIIFCE